MSIASDIAITIAPILYISLYTPILCVSRDLRVFMIKFAERLRELRREKKVTQSKMADFLGIKLRSYQNYEGGSRRPDYEGLVALADYFDVTTDYLLGRSDVRG